MPKQLKVVIIGAGVAGLCAARYASQSGHEVTIYEQTGKIGGTWVYTDRVGEDEYGLNVHTSMYQGLRTNLPKEIMGLGDIEMRYNFEQSYISSNQVLNFLDHYANLFQLKNLIKFRHYVIRVRPVEKSKWEVIVKDLPNDKVTTHIYDAIFVCNGQNSNPSWPSIRGMEKFRGVQIHSHDYRRPEMYKDKDVLIVGGGPSGVDITYAVLKHARRLAFSHRNHNPNHRFPTTVSMKGEIRELTDTGAIFMDGSEETFTHIVYCTGYKFTFPSLSVDCGIYVESNYIQPLYRHCINIMYPTMYIIGIPFYSCATQLRDIQVRYCMKFLNGEKKLPSTAEMLRDTEIDIEERRASGLPKRKWHSMGTQRQHDYFELLAAEAEIARVPEVIHRIYADNHFSRADHPSNYRDDIYRILDEVNFFKSTLTSAS